MFSAQSSTRDYITAEGGDFHEDFERTNKADTRPEEQAEKTESYRGNLGRQAGRQKKRDRDGDRGQSLTLTRINAILCWKMKHSL